MNIVPGVQKFLLLQLCWVIGGTSLLLCPAEAHVFKLYAGTNEELKERVVLHYTPEQATIEYSGEYHGQLAPHIRFMLDVNQDQKISSQEMQQFIEDYQQEWEQDSGRKLLNFDNLGFEVSVTQCMFPRIEDSKLLDPISVTIQFVSQPLHRNPSYQTDLHLLEISQELLFAFGRQFILMAKSRAAFTDEQENEIARFFQVSIRAAEQIEFIQCYPGYIKRPKNVIEGIFYDDSIVRMQFGPAPKISATFVIHAEDPQGSQVK